jgi:hypothetical protein
LSGGPAAGGPEAGRPATGRPEVGRPDLGHVAEGPTTGAGLGREVELIDRAAAAEREGRPDDALEAIRVFQREIGDRGQLAEEAAAIEIEVTCRRHGAATDQLAAFDRRWPSSAQRARLAAACGR